MGWISKRYMRRNHGLVHGVESERRKAPLRKIIEIIRVGDNNLFGSGDKVLLECGHEVYSKGTYKARCLKCKKETDNRNE